MKIRRGKHILILAIMLAHTVLWGRVFVDRRFADLIFTHYRSQIMYVVIMIVTVFAVHQFDAEESFLKCCYYTLSAVLVSFLLLNFSELDLSNLLNVMNVFARTRASFGFGHYNTLGAACVCNILMREQIKKTDRSIELRVVDGLILLVSAVMLLCSASRSAITSLALYYMIYYSSRLDQLRVSKRIIFVIKVFRALLVGGMILWVVLEVDFMALLVLAQRSHLVELALPMFFATGKLWLGLGYASNVAYAEGLTPYFTRWLDNAYVYYLITTGIIGLSLLLVALVVMGCEMYKRAEMRFGREMISVFAVYAYISLFETMLFSSGGLVNYIYIPWFLIHISSKSKPKAARLEAARGV